MAGWTGWELLLLLVASYTAVMSLVALMRIRRDEVVHEIEGEIADQKSQKEADHHRERQQRRQEEHAERVRLLRAQQEQQQQSQEDQLLQDLDVRNESPA